MEDTEDHEPGTKMSSRYNPQSSVAVPRSLSAITAHPSPFCDWLKPSHLGQPLPVAIPYLDTWSHRQPAGHHATGSSSSYISQPDESPTSVNRVSDTILLGDTITSSLHISWWCVHACQRVVTNATREATNLVKDSTCSSRKLLHLVLTAVSNLAVILSKTPRLILTLLVSLMELLLAVGSSRVRLNHAAVVMLFTRPPLLCFELELLSVCFDDRMIGSGGCRHFNGMENTFSVQMFMSIILFTNLLLTRQIDHDIDARNAMKRNPSCAGQGHQH